MYRLYAGEPVCSVEAIYFESDVLEQWHSSCGFAD
jgi:hypothetical protein